MREEVKLAVAAIPTIKGEPGRSLEYKGVYAPGTFYKDGNAVTFGGSIWIAKADTETAPGKSEDWQLAVKRGRDGKDAHAVRGS